MRTAYASLVLALFTLRGSHAATTGGSLTGLQNGVPPVDTVKSITVQVGAGGSQFSPNLVMAAPGDIVEFEWTGTGSFDIVPSSGPGSCQASPNIANDPGLMALASGPQTGGSHSFTIPSSFSVGVQISYFCSLNNACAASGMFGMIQVVASGSEATGVMPQPQSNTIASGLGDGTPTSGSGNTTSPTPTPDVSSAASSKVAPSAFLIACMGLALISLT